MSSEKPNGRDVLNKIAIGYLKLIIEDLESGEVDVIHTRVSVQIAELVLLPDESQVKSELTGWQQLVIDTLHPEVAKKHLDSTRQVRRILPY